MSDPTKDFVPMDAAQLARWQAIEAIPLAVVERLHKMAYQTWIGIVLDTREDLEALRIVAEALAGRKLKE